jgi:catechol 2,3-dioxygenase-like lactoylglutathione lyase family enzyme
MLKDGDTYSTLPTSDMARAREFFGGTLGFTIARDTEGGVMYRSGNTLFFVYPSRYRPGGHTQMSWFVKDIKAESRVSRRRVSSSSSTPSLAWR